MKKLVVILVFTLACIVAFGQKPLFPKRQAVTLNPNSGYVNINELNYGYGLGALTGPYSKQYFGLTTMHGYQLNIYGLHLNRSFLAGAGAGVLFYEGGPLIPFYLDFRYMWNLKGISPFIYEDSGVLLNFEDLIAGAKMFINPGAGAKLKISGSLAASLGAGLFVQMGTNASRDSFVNLKVGVVFKPR